MCSLTLWTFLLLMQVAGPECATKRTLPREAQTDSASQRAYVSDTLICNYTFVYIVKYTPKITAFVNRCLDQPSGSQVGGLEGKAVCLRGLELHFQL